MPQATLGRLLRRVACGLGAEPRWLERFAPGVPRVPIARGADRGGPAALPVAGGRSAKLARLEAALFAAEEPLTTKRLAEIAHLADGSEARSLIDELRARYAADRTGFTAEPIAGGWQLRTRRELAPWLHQLHASRGEARLSQPALETLAVVAYRQPILRSDIEAIRGVACGEMLRQLVDRGLVRIVGHDDSLGRPLLYGTTRKFLEVFGLASLGELPMADQLRMPAERSGTSGRGAEEAQAAGAAAPVEPHRAGTGEPRAATS